MIRCDSLPSIGENAANSADVARVLNDRAALISQAATTLEEEIQTTEIVVILADLQAGRAASFYRARLKQLCRQYADQYANEHDKPAIKS